MVLFRTDTVSAPHAALIGPGGASGFLAAATSDGASIGVASGTDGQATAVDSSRVASHVRELTAKNGVGGIDSIYSNAVAASARLTASQAQRIAADPAVGAVMADEEIGLDGVIEADGTEGHLPRPAIQRSAFLPASSASVRAPRAPHR